MRAKLNAKFGTPHVTIEATDIRAEAYINMAATLDLVLSHVNHYTVPQAQHTYCVTLNLMLQQTNSWPKRQHDEGVPVKTKVWISGSNPLLCPGNKCIPGCSWCWCVSVHRSCFRMHFDICRGIRSSEPLQAACFIKKLPFPYWLVASPIFTIMLPDNSLLKWPWIDHKPERAHRVGAWSRVSNWFNTHKFQLGSSLAQNISGLGQMLCGD